LIADFERRLADVLGARLPAAFGGHVLVAPGTGQPPMMLVGVQAVALLEDEFGNRPERVPGADDVRRVVRLSCTVAFTVRGSDAGGRAEELVGVDQLLYVVDAPDLRDGSALRPDDDSDPGFLIDAMRIGASTVLPGADPDTVPQVNVVARGWFWPPGTQGQTGVRIGEIRLRGVVLPIELSPRPAPVAGGPPIALTLSIRPTEPQRLREAPPPAPALPFGQLAVRLFGPGNRPPSGTLSGGSPGTDGSRLLDVAGDAATLTYTPSDAQAVDQLTVALEDGAGGQGIELARFPIRVGRA
jgi:hypothetical protein